MMGRFELPAYGEKLKCNNSSWTSIYGIYGIAETMYNTRSRNSIGKMFEKRVERSSMPSLFTKPTQRTDSGFRDFCASEHGLCSSSVMGRLEQDVYFEETSDFMYDNYEMCDLEYNRTSIFLFDDIGFLKRSMNKMEATDSLRDGLIDGTAAAKIKREKYIQRFNAYFPGVYSDIQGIYRI